jgi:hypothetical protein
MDTVAVGMKINRQPDLETPELSIWVMHVWEVPIGVTSVVKTQVPSVVIVTAERKVQDGSQTEPRLVA